VVPLWRIFSDYDYGMGSDLLDNYNVDQIIHNLQDCICAEGYYMDDDYNCQPCKSIHWDCTKCANAETCIECGSDFNMLTPVENDHVTCQPKMEFCDLPLYKQP